jgi:cytochrome c peroxidase
MHVNNPAYRSFRISKLLLPVVFSLVFTACQKDDPKETEGTGNEVISLQVPAGFPYPDIPADNMPTQNRINLGKKLFNDVILSQNNSISCSSCHREHQAFVDGFMVSTGINNHVGTRNAQTILNSAYVPALLWDGKFASLEDQVQGPIENTKEMGSDIDDAVVKLQNDPVYVDLFMKAYNEGPSVTTLKKAIANFERTLFTGSTRYDNNALNTSEQNGKALFFGKANCSGCHNGFNFTNNSYENNGLYLNYADSGRAMITQLSSDVGKFRVPSLRNIERTGPYMHDGKKSTLQAVVDHYNSGGQNHPNKSALIQPLGLTAQEKQDLVNFLKALSTI